MQQSFNHEKGKGLFPLKGKSILQESFFIKEILGESIRLYVKVELYHEEHKNHIRAKVDKM